MNYYKEDGSNISMTVVCSFYMELENLKRQVPSLKLTTPYAPNRALYIDGVYQFFDFGEGKETPKLSTDGSREYILGYDNGSTISLWDFAGYQPRKRQYYVDLAADIFKSDVMIIIDADEYIDPNYCDWQYFRKRLVQYINKFDPDGKGFVFNLPIWFEEGYEKAHNLMNTGQWNMNPRVWHRPEKLEYYGGVHYWVRHRKPKSSMEFIERLGSTPVHIYEGIRFRSDSKLRTREFLDARDKWAKRGLDHETELVKMHEHFGAKFPADKYIGKRLVNPLVVILQPRILPRFLVAVERELQFVDKYWLKFFNQTYAYFKARQTFLEEIMYSHLVILPDDLIVTMDDYCHLYNDIVANDYPVISGYCNLDAEHPTLSNICLTKLPPNPPQGHTLDDYDFASLDELDNIRKSGGWSVLDVKYAGFPLTFIRRDIVEQIPFRDADGCCPDSLFAVDLAEKGIPQFVDLRVQMYHMKLGDGKYENMQTGIKQPEALWEYRKL